MREKLYGEDWEELMNCSLSLKYGMVHGFFVFVIDEWDCIFRVKENDTKAQKKYLNFLRDLLKPQPYCVLAYMTGILPL